MVRTWMFKGLLMGVPLILRDICPACFFFVEQLAREGVKCVNMCKKTQNIKNAGSYMYVYIYIIQKNSKTNKTNNCGTSQKCEIYIKNNRNFPLKVRKWIV